MIGGGYSQGASRSGGGYVYQVNEASEDGFERWHAEGTSGHHLVAQNSYLDCFVEIARHCKDFNLAAVIPVKDQGNAVHAVRTKGNLL